MRALVSQEVALTQAALDFRGCPHMGDVPPDLSGRGDRQLTRDPVISNNAAGLVFGGLCSRSPIHPILPTWPSLGSLL